MSPFVDTNRPIRLSKPWDKLIVTDVRGREGISELFHFEISVVAQDSKVLKPDDILLQSVTIEMHMEKSPRYINGIVKSIVQGPLVKESGLILYTLVLVPKAWVLTHESYCRIYQHQTAMDIVKRVLKDCGTTEIDDKVKGSLKSREYCVQYNETDFAFISRLLEFEGICYFFRHEAGKHTIVFANDKTAFKDVAVTPTIEYDEVIGGLRENGRIHDWHKTNEYRAGNYHLNDYNFETPKENLVAKSETKDHKMLFYDNAGGYDKLPEGEALAKIRVEEEQVPSNIVHGKSLNWNLASGYRFTLAHHFADDNKFTLTRVTHYARQPLEVSDNEEPFSYENDFTCIPWDTPYRPARFTPAPSVRGVQTAKVVGPAGEEIYTDKYGRVKVRFHWDSEPQPEGAKDENASCWIRVASYWAGKQWGAIHIPRIGQEVIVDFVEGDVDRPIIVGSVYNADNMPPYALPGDKTKSALKSDSSKGSGGYNEFRFEDLKGKEEVYFQAEKDHNTLIKHDETRKVKNDRTTEIFHDENQTVHNNETIIVKEGNQTITLEQGNQSTRLKMGNQSTKLDMGNQDTKLSMGNQSTKLDLGAATHEAMQSITLKVGQSSIVVDQVGVTIKGLMIKIEATAILQEKAPLIQINADGIAILKGGIVLIN
jgi:type VI secretion system secreted protein VgrG